MKPKIFTYWEGWKPAYIGLCECIIKKQTMAHFDYCPLTNETVFDYLNEKDMPLNFFKLPPHHKADYLRGVLLLKHGGVWLDVDQILTSDLSIVNTLSNDFAYISYEWEPLCPSGGFIAAQKNCRVLEEWKDKMDFQLQTRSQFGWEELMYRNLHPILQKQIAESGFKYYGFPARTSFAPIYWSDWGNFFNCNLEIDTSQLHSVMLYNSQFPEWFKQLSAEDILKESYAISKLFKRLL